MYKKIKFFTLRPLDIQNYFDREEELAFLRTLLRSNQPVLLLGNRRVGKTMTMYKLFSEFCSQETIPIYINLLGAMNPQGLIREVHESLSRPPLPLPGECVKTRRNIIKSFLDYLKKLNITIDPRSGMVKIGFKTGSFENRFNVLSIFFEDLESIARKHRKTIILMMDEIHKLPQLFLTKEVSYRECSRTVYALIKKVNERYSNIVVFASSSKIAFPKEILRDYHPLYNSFYIMQLNQFSRKIAMQFLYQGLESNNIRVLRSGFNKLIDIYEITQGIPYWLNWFGIEIVIHSFRSGQNVLDGRTLSKIMRYIIGKAHRIVTSDIYSMIQRELHIDANILIKILKELCEKPSYRDLFRKIKTKYNLKGKWIRVVIKTLTDYGIASNIGGHVVISDTFTYHVLCRSKTTI